MSELVPAAERVAALAIDVDTLDVPASTLRLLEATKELANDLAGNVRLADVIANMATIKLLETDANSPEWQDTAKFAYKCHQGVVMMKETMIKLSPPDQRDSLRRQSIDIAIVSSDQATIDRRTRLANGEDPDE